MEKLNKITQYYFAGVFIFIVFSNQIVKAQSINTKIFIEPNVSLGFDSNFFNTGEIYYGEQYLERKRYASETHSLKHLDKDNSKILVFIEANLNYIELSDKSIDSIIDISIETLKFLRSDTVEITKSYKFNYKGFWGIGLIAQSKSSNSYALNFKCTHFSNNGTINIEYSVSKNLEIADFDKDYAILKNIIDGIKVYNIKNLDKEDSILKLKYSKIFVDPQELKSDLPERFKPTFAGKIRIDKKMENTIIAVQVVTNKNGGYQEFFSNSNGEIIIECQDVEKGTRKRDCKLVILNSVGKKVYVPFSFTYINK